MSELLGRFQLLRKLATGGMGDVFLALQWGDGEFVRPAVVKRMHPHLLERPVLVADFQHEARLLGLLTHPGIPHAYDFRHGACGWYLAMEHIEGPTLDALLRASAHAPLPMSCALSVAGQLCAILTHVHGCADPRSGAPLGLIHGDLSPQNVILGRDRVVLVDFGLAGSAAHREQQRQRDSSIRGTLGYMAPEVIAGREVSASADLFVLGILLYEMTTGTRLFAGDGLQAMNATLERSVPLPTRVRPGYPRELEHVVMHCLDRSPRGRPADARALLGLLEDFARSQHLALGAERYLETAAALVPLQPQTPLPTERPPGLGSAPPPPRRSSLELSEKEKSEVLQDLDALLSPELMGSNDGDDDAELIALLESDPPPKPREPNERPTRRIPMPPEESTRFEERPGFYSYHPDNDAETQ